MKRYSGLIIFLCGFFGLLFAGIIISQVLKQPDYARITALEYTAEVVDEKEGDRGKVKITERLTFDIHAALYSDRFWELWRDLPEEYVDGAKVEYKVTSVKRVSVDGKPDGKVFTEASRLYTQDSHYTNTAAGYGPDKWYHSKGPYDGENNWECVLFYVDGLYRETTVFEIEYEMYNATLRYADCSELYVSLFSGKDIKHLKSVKGQFLIPETKMPSAGNYDAHTYGTNSHAFDFTESATANAGFYTFSFGLDESQLKFKPYNRYIEFAMVTYGEDKHAFTQYADKANIYYKENVLDDLRREQADYERLPVKWRNIKIGTLAGLAAVAALVILLVVYNDKKIRKAFFRPAQDFDFYREIPNPLDTAFAGAFALCKHKMSDEVPGAFGAAMLGLVKKKYIEVQRIDERGKWAQGNIIIFLNEKLFDKATGKAILPPLTQSETLYYGLIKKYAARGSITFNGFQTSVSQDYQNTDAVRKNVNGLVKSIGMSGGYFQKADYKEKRRSARGAIIFLFIIGAALMIFNAVSTNTNDIGRLGFAFGAFFIAGAGFFAAAIMLWLFSRKRVLLSQFGEDEYSKWRGLYKFLKSETLMKERTVSEVAIWEDYLIYATAFGISEKVIKALEARFPEFNQSSSLIIRHPFFCSVMFTRVYTRSFRTTVRAASFASRSGSHGGGFGGGYGGGGRGGGGGGGGH